MAIVKVPGVSKSARDFVNGFDDKDEGRLFRDADRTTRIAEKRFSAKCKEQKSGDVVVTNEKGQQIGQWFEEHSVGVVFAKASDFAKFVKLCEKDGVPAKKGKGKNDEDDGDEEPKSKRGSKKKPAPAKRGKKGEDSDDDGDEEPKKRAKPGAKEKEVKGKKGKPAKAESNDDDDDDNWSAPKGKKGKKAQKEDEDDGDEPSIELEVSDDNHPAENAEEVVKALKKELKRLKVKSGNLKDLLELLDGYLEEAKEAGGESEGSDDDNDSDDDNESNDD